METKPSQVDAIKTNEFVFSSRYKLLRHVLYWVLTLIVWACYWTLVRVSFIDGLLGVAFWLPLLMLYTYPVAYIALPKLLLKSKYVLFALVIIFWGISGWYFSIFYHEYVYFPLADYLKVAHGSQVEDPESFFCMTTSVGCMSMCFLTKRWLQKQQEWLEAEKEKVTAELKLTESPGAPSFSF